MWNLPLDPHRINRARQLAQQITEQLTPFFRQYSTISIERTIIRLFGVDGTDEMGIPLANRFVDYVEQQGRITDGAALIMAALVRDNGQSPQQIVEQIIKSHKEIPDISAADNHQLHQIAKNLSRWGLDRIDRQREKRTELQIQNANNHEPLLYVIVATGNIHEDIPQARAAVQAGADVIAVIRSTAQSLLDYVPYGATTEGFGGTYATQENFRIMREALDELMDSEKRYLYLTNYASGLCMPEIAAMASLERLDMLLNDALYGILFRDINPRRTLLDQYFSRMINAYAGIIINTGEDNYLTTSDAIEKAHTVLASQLINEQFACQSGLSDQQMGLGHAFEINPEIKNSFLFELSHALLARTVFPNAPLKYMPPTKHMDGNIFRTYAVNSMFNFAGKLTHQKIQLLGMLTEAIHTPFLQDRYLAIQNSRYIMNAISDLADQFEIKPDSFLVQRAEQVLGETIALLEEVNQEGLFEALAKGVFAEIKRPMTGGKGAEGVFAKKQTYINPFFEYFSQQLIFK